MTVGMNIKVTNEDEKEMFQNASDALLDIKAVMSDVIKKHDACSLSIAFIMLTACNSRGSGQISRDQYLSMCAQIWDSVIPITKH